MEKNKKNEGTEQGSGAFKTISEGQFQEYVKKDLNIACSLLNALSQDTNALNNLGSFLYGQYQNRIHKSELEKQTKIEA